MTTTTKPAWVIRWRSSHMAGPAFWYFNDYDNARQAALELQPEVDAAIERTAVAANFKCLDERLAMR